MRFKHLTRLHKHTKRKLWALLDEQTKAGLKKIRGRATPGQCGITEALLSLKVLIPDSGELYL